MIERSAVRNCKSLAQFKLLLQRFKYLVGMNGAGATEDRAEMFMRQPCARPYATRKAG